MVRRPTAFLVDTDILIDYLNGVQRMREILDVPRYRVYYSAVTRKEILAKRGLSAAERQELSDYRVSCYGLSSAGQLWAGAVKTSLDFPVGSPLSSPMNRSVICISGYGGKCNDV